MKKTWIICSLVMLILTTVTSADLFAPGGLNPGDTFRWVFQTSEHTDATSQWISYYDDFVNTVADDAAAPVVHNVQGISDVGEINWLAIVSTQQGGSPLGARAHIGTNSSGPPVYNTQQQIVADNTWHLFQDQEVDNAITYDESGTFNPTERVWTGSDESGYPQRPLGNEQSMYGLSSNTNWQWLGWPGHNFIHYGAEYSVYAISEELTVVPLPSAAILGFIGMATSSLALRKRRKKTVATESAL